jgi:hypothetical protein
MGKPKSTLQFVEELQDSEYGCTSEYDSLYKRR